MSSNKPAAQSLEEVQKAFIELAKSLGTKLYVYSQEVGDTKVTAIGLQLKSGHICSVHLHVTAPLSPESEG